MTNREWLLNKMQSMSDEEFAEIFSEGAYLCKLRNCEETANTPCKDCELNFYSKKPTKLESFWENTGKCVKPNVFNHLFQFITWQDDEPYNIEELLKN